MSQPIILKAYGNLFPTDCKLYEKLFQAGDSAFPNDPPCVNLDGDMIIISFEGIYFPEQTFLEIISANLTKKQSGKLDILDLENWLLIRHVFLEGKIINKTAPLNNVLDYSGH